jgi:hypothetical protein
MQGTAILAELIARNAPVDGVQSTGIGGLTSPRIDREALSDKFRLL